MTTRQNVSDSLLKMRGVTMEPKIELDRAVNKEIMNDSVACGRFYSPTSDWSAFANVMEKMVSKGWSVSINWGVSAIVARNYFESFISTGPDNMENGCRAALLAVRAQKADAQDAAAF